jgi:transcription initiation factor IIE alpha subunit
MEEHEDLPEHENDIPRGERYVEEEVNEYQVCDNCSPPVRFQVNKDFNSGVNAIYCPFCGESLNDDSDNYEKELLDGGEKVGRARRDLHRASGFIKGFFG